MEDHWCCKRMHLTNKDMTKNITGCINPTNSLEDAKIGKEDRSTDVKNAKCLFILSTTKRTILYHRRIPERFCKARTVFIPKKPAATEPDDFRPISLTPIPARLFSKILARRQSPTNSIEPEQQGFIKTDGISQNIFMLDFVLRHAIEQTKRIYIASIDIRKAFDSVSHEAVFNALEAQSIDPEFIKLIKFMYQNSSTHSLLFRTILSSQPMGLRRETHFHLSSSTL
ncbi:Retrovirus-related Pol polyprotein from type-1 retrotransposable element R2 [Araneus ventricosus]|uniref:Retrovirus-related Pol polyprotein from type-1 retrotransposable element R2 n=1 Tax=Araneus ventricosus TaxID=182803 RepID=A0A4Y2VRZ6_ARAVE|nr:Retrovirus-related Pol polyprotein from type-1 retrotransposable element R2 [Araneus ventricosus]